MLLKKKSTGKFDNLVGASLLETGLNFTNRDIGNIDIANIDIANATPDSLQKYTPPNMPA